MPTKKTFRISDFPQQFCDRVRNFPDFFPECDLLFEGDDNFELAELREFSCVGVIGTRRPTAYGLRFLNAWLDQQAEEGFAGVLLSGGALGIDGAVHAGALSRGLSTQAMVVGPLARPSPSSHASLFSRVRSSARGAIWVPQCLEPTRARPPQSAWWLYRNQWLSALCDVIIVVEAGLYSGTWHTVKVAREIGIPVYALPGSFDGPVSQGTNAMIARGYAHPITTLTELQKTLVAELGGRPYNISRGPRFRGTTYANAQVEPNLREPQTLRTETEIVKNIRFWLRQPGGIGLQDLVSRALEAGYTVANITGVLEEMNRKGEISQLGDRFEGRR